MQRGALPGLNEGLTDGTGFQPEQIIAALQVAAFFATQDDPTVTRQGSNKLICQS